MFVIFMMNMGVWSFQTNWLAHEIEHTTEAALTMLPSDHGDAHSHASTGDNDAPSTAEHQLLHAADHLQLFPSTIIPQGFVPQHSGVLTEFRLPAVPLAASESPFRPPRNISSLA